jgi:uncharacterized protein YdeI (YjbR/CyaY-like superfamily)
MELCFTNRSEWRKWLEENSESSEGIWMKMYKKHTGIQCVPYPEAVEEALCFGWIDGKIKRINDEYYVQHFTHRNPGSRWSKYNIERVEKLIKEGKMTSPGLRAYDELKRKPHLAYENRKSGEPVIPDELLTGLKTNGKAFENFMNFPPYARRMYIEWFNYAKQDKTRVARLEKIIRFSEQNQRPGIL